VGKHLDDVSLVSSIQYLPIAKLLGLAYGQNIDRSFGKGYGKICDHKSTKKFLTVRLAI